VKQSRILKSLMVVVGSLAASAVFAAVIIAPMAPPAPRAEVIPPVRVGFVWDPGHWNWVGGHYVWAGGRWLPERPGHRWVPGHWDHVGAQWRWIDGHWV